MSITVSLKQGEEVRDVKIPTEWKDMTLKYWCGMITIIKSHFDKAKLRANSLGKKQEEKNHLEEYIDFAENELEDFQNIQLNRDLFGYMTSLDKDQMNLIDIDSVNNVISVLESLMEEYKPKNIRSFEYEGETYYFPSEFLKRNTYGDYIESTQLDMYIETMKHGKFDVLPEQMAILCRKIDEEYDDDAIPEKTEKFKNLTMDTVWEFSFFLTQQNLKLARLLSMSSEKKEKVK
tara:strand:- start:705 stop:1406 length:702 start_codon:yes stop_codon:yes gene_type:complete